MLPAERDFAFTVERATGLIVDAACSARGALRVADHGRLPLPHRKLLSTAIAALEKAQRALFDAHPRNNPWDQPQQPRQRQLELPLSWSRKKR